MRFFSSLKQRAIIFLEPYKTKGPATYAAAEQAIGALLIRENSPWRKPVGCSEFLCRVSVV